MSGPVPRRLPVRRVARLSPVARGAVVSLERPAWEGGYMATKRPRGRAGKSARQRQRRGAAPRSADGARVRLADTTPQPPQPWLRLTASPSGGLEVEELPPLSDDELRSRIDDLNVPDWFRLKALG